jgi:transglutaminase-like putative cysteine protease
MRLGVVHDTKYTYVAPARSAIQVLRVTPRNHRGQHVRRWRVDVNHDCTLNAFEDAFGNLAHVFTIDRPLATLQITVTGEVDTQDTNGVVTGAVERFPPALFLRETPLTATDPDIAAFALKAGGGGGNTLNTLHALMGALFETLKFDTEATDVTTSAGQAFTQRRGVCQDFAHIFIAAARKFEIPARYVAGHLWRADGRTQQAAGHAWAEAYVEDLGWVGFDAANGIGTTEAYIRVAVGLDSVGAAPIRGTVFGGVSEALEVSVSVEELHRRRRSQMRSEQ